MNIHLKKKKYVTTYLYSVIDPVLQLVVEKSCKQAHFF
jgi:hypothetical protein